MGSASFGDAEIIYPKNTREEYVEIFRRTPVRDRKYIAAHSEGLEDLSPGLHLPEIADYVERGDFRGLLSAEGGESPWGKTYKFGLVELGIYAAVLDIVKETPIAGFERIRLPMVKSKSGRKRL